MKPSTTSTTLLALLGSAALLSLAGAARAEEKPAANKSDGANTPAAQAEAAPQAEPAPQAAPPAPQAAPTATPAPSYAPPSYAYPPGYGPPPGYGYPPGYGPPPGYGYPPAYGPPPGYHARYYYPPPRVVAEGRETYRPFTIAMGLGMGSIGLLNKGGWGPELGMSYSLRIGFGITPRWLVSFAADGSWANFDKTSYSLASYTAGAQFFATRSWYVRAGLGVGCSSGEDRDMEWSDCNGQTAVTAIGVEFAQSHSTAFALEVAGGFTRFGDMWDPHKQGWRTGQVLTHIGVNLVLNLF